MTTPNTHPGLEFARQMDRLHGREDASGAAALVEEALAEQDTDTPDTDKKLPKNQNFS